MKKRKKHQHTLEQAGGLGALHQRQDLVEQKGHNDHVQNVIEAKGHQISPGKGGQLLKLLGHVHILPFGKSCRRPTLPAGCGPAQNAMMSDIIQNLYDKCKINRGKIHRLFRKF